MGDRKILKSGNGWRLGWDPDAGEFTGLLGNDTWAMELTAAELEDFCQLLEKLATTMEQMAEELMDEERIACEAQSDRMWMQVEGFPHAYSLQVILTTGRRCEGYWEAEAIAHLLAAARSLSVF
ncbi:DUF1818 family protein [Geitlerinema sp. PCC 9228]|uniref:DUF1818 family protein n=1 Tax=Geitlerinema sp. PCC 9228 TaxID=111611 RepID=UPI0008F9B185|nr:DUF1818 family protein [Geitlerinema sp. PCC 9228]